VSGVRAYPSSEGGGSEGYLFNLEVRKQLPENFTLTGFYDWGSVLVTKNDATANSVNNYDLKGVGVSLGWTAPFGFNLKATLARRIGDNPNPTTDGNDQDGSLSKNRLWLQANMPL
jgi:hemolysin activation/secretion protein